MEYENSGGHIVNGQCIPSQKWNFTQQVLTLSHTKFVKEL